MIEFVWEVVVKEQSRGQFELSFGPGGAWSKLFAKSPGFRGITLLRDMQDPRHYLVVDIWDSEIQREQSLAEHKAEHEELQAALGAWTESVTELGAYRVMAEGTVRSRSFTRRCEKRTPPHQGR
jgi:heme-degrading monooxygenase HmoA